jgi:hypothetical protein
VTSSTLILAITAELAKPEHAEGVLPVCPRSEIRLRRKWPRPASTAVDLER